MNIKIKSKQFFTINHHIERTIFSYQQNEIVSGRGVSFQAQHEEYDGNICIR